MPVPGGDPVTAYTLPVSPDRQVLDRLEVSTALLASIQEAVQWPVRQPV